MSTDNLIVELKEKIEALKSTKDKKSDLKTNCILNMQESNCNLNVQGIDGLLTIHAYLSGIQSSIKSLKLKGHLIEGHPVEDWLHDIHEMIKRKQSNDKKNQLNKLERALEQLMSDEKKAEIEVQNIAKTLDSLK